MRRLLLAGIAAVAAALPLPTAAMAGPAAPAVPSDIAVPAGHKPYLAVHAEGVQIYACYSVADGYAWRLLAPRATLTGDNGKVARQPLRRPDVGGPRRQHRRRRPRRGRRRSTPPRSTGCGCGPTRRPPGPTATA